MVFSLFFFSLLYFLASWAQPHRCGEGILYFVFLFLAVLPPSLIVFSLFLFSLLYFVANWEGQPGARAPWAQPQRCWEGAPRYIDIVLKFGLFLMSCCCGWCWSWRWNRIQRVTSTSRKLDESAFEIPNFLLFSRHCTTVYLNDQRLVRDLRLVLSQKQLDTPTNMRS